ncbi:MAG TPA: SMC-Scp complex subunit ScpB [Pseudobdellovibrionaceae bacterium]|nr:SMC-Scp complex subunit ScpB [Pseudobdellovibrionaceae bacterium]
MNSNDTDDTDDTNEFDQESAFEQLDLDPESEVKVDGTELDTFESASIEELEPIEEERLESIVESILFASERPISLATIKQIFKGTNVTNDRLRRTLDKLSVEYAGGRRGVVLEEVTNGFQVRTKPDNQEFLKRNIKGRPFRLSQSALEVMSIVAYKQPVIKHEVDLIRGVESGHILRALMEKNLVQFEGRSDLPGKPIQYGTTRKFLEIFGLRNIKELPTLSQIDELMPEGIGDEEVKEKTKLADITDSMSENIGSSYSEGEEELGLIQESLFDINTSTEFFEEEKRRRKEVQDRERAQNIREALTVGEPVTTKDLNWLKKYDEALVAKNAETHP